MKFYNDNFLESQLKEAHEKYDNDKEKILGITLNQPFEPLNSSSRKLMFSIHCTHRTNLLNPEIPLVETGYENRFGETSSSIIKTEGNWRVLAKIDKYSSKPGFHYYLIVINDNNEIDILERISYHHSTETYGYMYDNNYIDTVEVGNTIPSDTIIRKSTAFDEYNNHMNGTNLNCCYMAIENTTEDPVIISETAAKKLATPKIRKCTITINDNDIPLNIYGINGEYKIFPDIGEEITGGYLACIRQENKDESFFNQSINRLSTPMINDIKYPLTGTVLDIDVRCNKQFKDDENDMYNCYEGQLKSYIDEDKRFCREFVDAMKGYIQNSNYKKSYKLSALHHKCMQKLSGTQYIKDTKVFSNIEIEIYIYEENKMGPGDKISNRYGGKGVVSEVWKDELMPRLEGSDKCADLIWNQSTCVNRLNNGQLMESSLNWISKHLLMYMESRVLHTEEYLEILIDYFSMISDDMATYLKELLESQFNDYDALSVISGLISSNDDGIYLSLKPITECVDIDTITRIYNKFPWIKPKNLLVPIKGTNGQIRYVHSSKKSILSSQYVYRMKQCAEEKHSANSMSSTNIRNENAKSRANKLCMAVHSSTPIRNGEMESNIFIHLGPEIYVTNLMLNSTSPQGRRNAEKILSGDAYDVNITLNPDDKSRSVEKFNATLKTMGLKMNFIKRLKVKRYPFIRVARNTSPFEKAVNVGSPFQHVVERKSPFEKVSRDE